jgi:glycogen phosphorylase
LFLLDTDISRNGAIARWITARLYDADPTIRLSQYLMLGFGGIRALQALGIDPGVIHLNEGHAALAPLAFGSLEEGRARTVFTTHTPVPAGNDCYPPEQLERAVAGLADELPISVEKLTDLGRSHPGNDSEPFGVTQAALRASRAANGVSRRHGQVARTMWSALWPASTEVPIGQVTNGVHVPTWIAGDLAELFCRYLGPDWLERQDNPTFWNAVLDIPDDELWRVRQTLRAYLFAFVRERARYRWTEEHVGIPRVVAAGPLLDPEALTLGFARRFAGYKRPELLFHDPERLARILNAAGRPVQVIFAGKAHPADDIGKHHLQRVYKHALDPLFAGRVAFVDDYDLHVAHFLVQGCDVWLNNPRKPLEASGTSGMKAAINGVPHLSIGDGWWAEGFTGSNGWIIDGGVAGDHYDAVDAADADALYRLLEQEIVPAFYERDAARVPHRWMATVKEAMRTVAPHFSARRMVKEYVERMYAPALDREGVARP